MAINSNLKILLRYKLIIISVVTILTEIFSLNYLYDTSFEKFYKLQKKTAERIAEDVNKATVASNIMGGAEILGVSNKRIRDVLLGITKPGNFDVNKVLEVSRHKYRASIVYVMNLSGDVVASTIYDNNKSLLGKNYAFRPYFIEAAKGKRAVYPALGVTTKVRGIYLAAPVYDIKKNKTHNCIGVIVFKTNLSRIDTLLSKQHTPTAMASPQGIIFSSNIDDWRFKSTSIFTKKDIMPLRKNRQFGDLFEEKFPAAVPFEKKDNFINFENKRYHPVSCDVSITDNFGHWKILYLAEADNWLPFEIITAAFLIILLTGALLSLYAVLATQHKIEQAERIKLAEKSQQNIRSIFEAVNDLILVFDFDSYKFIDANQKAFLFFDITKSSGSRLEGFDFGAKIIGFEPEIFLNSAELSKSGKEQNFEWPVLSTENEIRWMDVNLKPVELSDQKRLIVVMIDITERKNMEDSIKNINIQLEKRVHERTSQLESANKELEAFCYSVSHDLRSPLVSIQGFSQVLEYEYGKDLKKDALSFIQRIYNASKRMEDIIEDILMLSRLTKGDLNRNEVNLSTIAESVFNQVKQSYNKRAAEINITENMIANADSRLIQIAFENLIGNAWKFTSRKPITIIEVGKEIINNEVVFYIKDNGAGFNNDKADRLFIPFERQHPKSEFDGSGIGLATVKRIITRHSGRIWAEGEPGEGATFYFTLPDN